MSEINKINIVDLHGKTVNSINTPNVLLVDFNPQLIQEVYHYHSFNRRQATYGTLRRSELSYSTRKLYQQKRTGRARIGSRGAVHHRKGNVCFGPDGRQYDMKMPKRKIRNALFSLLSKKLTLNELIIVDHMNLPVINTKAFVSCVNSLKIKKGVFIDNVENNNLKLSLRNIPNINFLPNIAFNVFDLFGNKTVVLSMDSLNKLEKLYE